MMQDRARKNHIEAGVQKWQSLREILNNLYFQRGLFRQSTYCTGAHDGARIRLQRGHRKTLARQRVACDTSAGTNVKRTTGPTTQQGRNGLPFGRPEIARRRFYERVVVVSVTNKLLLIWLVAQPD